MQIEDYMKKRLQPQIEYYSSKSASSKKEFYWLSILALVANATIPVITLSIDSTGPSKYFVAILSAISAIFSGILLIKKAQDTWVCYRLTCEALKREKVLFETKSGKYRESSFNDFVIACEEIMANENAAWKSLAKSEETNIKEK